MPMLKKEHNLTYLKPSYSDTDSFLEDVKNELVYRHFSQKLEALKKHWLKQESESITLSFDYYDLELPGRKEVEEAIRGLEQTLNKLKKN